MAEEVDDDALGARLGRLHDDPAARVSTLAECCQPESRTTGRHDVFAALANRVRLRLLAVLTDRECCVCELQAVLDAAQSTVSTQLSRLAEAGLVTHRREGRWRYYRAAPGVPELLVAADALGSP